MASTRTSPRFEHPVDDAEDSAASSGFFSRERSLALAFVGLLGICLYLCYLLALPFLSAIAWAGALAVVLYPLHTRIEKRLQRPNVAAGISVALAATAVVGPAYVVLHTLVRQVAEGVEMVRSQADAVVARHPRLAPFWQKINSGELPDEIQGAARDLAGSVPGYVTGSIWVGAQLLITFFMLFYFLRDRRTIVRSVSEFLPLTRNEVRRTIRRTEDTVFASIYGSLTVALVQGALGGLMFWWLGIPTPLLWGVVMAVLATIPMLGTFIVWLPAAVFLAIEGEWWKAVILVVWGSMAIGLIDNVLYPYLVGSRLRLHPLPVFIAIVGGIALFGAAGVVLGPIVLSVTEALLDVWQRRTADGGTLEAGAENC